MKLHISEEDRSLNGLPFLILWFLLVLILHCSLAKMAEVRSMHLPLRVESSRYSAHKTVALQTSH